MVFMIFFCRLLFIAWHSNYGLLGTKYKLRLTIVIKFERLHLGDFFHEWGGC